MSSSTGILEIKHKYKWAYTTEGKIAIFNVPIFALFDDPERGVFSEENAAAVLKNNYEEINNGHYRRIHREHHDGITGSREPVGFLGKFRLVDSVIYADFLHVDRWHIQTFQNAELPYVSVEFGTEDPVIGRVKITSAALMASEPPFFPFPIIAIEENPITPTEEQVREFKEQVKEFFRLERISMDPDKEPKAPQDDNFNEDGDDQMKMFGEMRDCMTEIKDTLGGIKQFMESMQKPKDDEEDEPKPPSGQNPEPVAGSTDDKFAAKIMDQFKELRKEISVIKAGKEASDVETRLRTICNNNFNLDYETERKTVEKFSGLANKNAYLDLLVSNSQAQPSRHPISQITEHFKEIKDDSLRKKYAREDTRIQKVAARAAQDWHDSAYQKDQFAAEKFVQANPDQEKFVATWVKMEKKIPGSYNPE